MSAATLFPSLAYISLRFFTRGDKDPTEQKLRRNVVYRLCGWFMLACIVLIAIYNWFLQDTGLADFNPVFWLESLALWAFGWVCFVKGEGLRLPNDPV